MPVKVDACRSAARLSSEHRLHLAEQQQPHATDHNAHHSHPKPRLVTMPGGHGQRSRTRDLFSRPYRGKGYIPLSTYLRTYKIGDYVDIKVNAAVQKVDMSHL